MFKLSKAVNIQLGTKKVCKKSEASIKCIWKTKHNTKSTQSIQNSWHYTSNTHCSLQPFTGIITGKIENIQIDLLNYYFGEETLEECQDEPTKNKADWPLTSLQEKINIKKTKNTGELKPCIYWVIL